jgi:UDP-glucose 4-epimerase
MPVPVNGGAACIGHRLVLDAIDAGEEVIVLDTLSTGLAWAVRSGVSIVRGDAGNAAPESMPPKYALPARHRFAAKGNLVPIGSGRLLTVH